MTETAAENVIMAKKMKEMIAKLSKMKQDDFFKQVKQESSDVSSLMTIDEDNDSEAETRTEAQEVEEHIVGRIEDKRRIMATLPASGTIILPLVGVGGIGKTKLAREVFNDSQFKGYNFRAWLDVSEKFDLLEIGKSLLFLASGEEGFGPDSDRKKYITERLHGLYNGMKVLVVLDGVGEAPGDSSEWRNFKHMLRVGGKGSKVVVIVTTCSQTIAKKICTVKPHMLNPLTDDTCWTIVKQTSGFNDQSDKEELEHIGRQIASKCKGLPLAAKKLGRLLQSKDARRWSAVMDSAAWNDDVTEKPGCLGFLRKKNPMANGVETMEAKLEMIKDELDRHGSDDSNQEDIIWAISSILEQDMDVTETTPKVEDPRILGRGEDKESILAELSASNIREGLVILPIVGLGGIGKTALAQIVFNDTQFKEYNFRAWVHVSPKFDLLDIGRSLVSLAMGEEPHDSHGIEYVSKRIQHLYNGMKVLIVLDDLWEEDSDKLERLKSMFNPDGKTSKVIVIVTTCSEGVARKICTVQPYKLNPLTRENCWTIIEQTSGFDGREDKEEVRKLGWQIAGNCGGLPLAAQKLGVWLSDEDSEEWLKMSVIGIWISFQCLVLTYRRLPLNLRLCFAYCAIFPKGHNIVKDDLINQWTALDLIHPSGNAKKLAEEYIGTLLDISFLQTAKSSLTSGKDGNAGAVLLTMHDLVHGLAMAAVGEEFVSEEFIAVARAMDSSHPNEYCRYARLTNSCDRPPGLLSAAQLSALYCSKMDFGDSSCQLPYPNWNLRVLYFQESPMQKLPNFVCQQGQLGHLNLSGCSSLTALPDSFETLLNLHHINLSSCSGLVNLPQSFGKLIKLQHVDLSGCFGLQELPESIGKLTKLLHMYLSACSGLVHLPESFCDLRSLIHLSLSDCTRLKTLPESFGDLISLLHINLSRCHQLVKLPESFGELRQLEHLDLSFWSCFGGIKEILRGLTNLKHLNLSHPCCFPTEPQSLLEGLINVVGELTKLKYLNLSMFLSPILGYQPGEESLKCIEYICELSELEHLDLSHNMFLYDLPKRLAEFTSLCTLDLSNCIRLKSIDKKIGEMGSMKLIVVRNCRGLESYPFKVRSDDGRYSSNLGQLEDVSCKELEISCLENVKSVLEARRTRMARKQKLEKLVLCWTEGCRVSVDSNALLGELLPFAPCNMRCLELHGYNGTDLPTWTSSAESPAIDELLVRKCPKLSFVLPPSSKEGKHPRSLHGPGARRLVISDSDQLMGHTGHLLATPTELVVESCKVPLGDWSLLHHLPGLSRLKIKECHHLTIGSPGISRIPSTLQSICFSWCDNLSSLPEYLGELTGLHELKIKHCKKLTSLPDGMKLLTSLQTLHLIECESMGKLPEWFGSLTSLEKLTIDKCPGIKTLPGIDKLKKLKDPVIEKDTELRKWWDGKAKMLAPSQPKTEENPTGKNIKRAGSRLHRSTSQLPQTEPTR